MITWSGGSIIHDSGYVHIVRGRRRHRAEDYARHGLPFRFDRDHDRCPNDGAIMNVQQKMVMPNLRLTLEESRDIASYLTSLKAREPESFPALLDDPAAG